MKLYEFSIVGDPSIDGEEINRMIKEILEEEYQFQGWSPGYICTKISVEPNVVDIGIEFLYEPGEVKQLFRVDGELCKKRWPDE